MGTVRVCHRYLVLLVLCVRVQLILTLTVKLNREPEAILEGRGGEGRGGEGRGGGGEGAVNQWACRRGRGFPLPRSESL